MQIVSCGNAPAARLLAAAPKYSKPAHFSDISTHNEPPGLDAQKTIEAVSAKVSMTQSRWKSPTHNLFVTTVTFLTHLLNVLLCEIHPYPSSCLWDQQLSHRLVKIVDCFRGCAGMGSVWKRLNRINKRAAKFHFTASYSELWLEVTLPPPSIFSSVIVIMSFIPWLLVKSLLQAGPNWQPTALSVIWTRKSR